MALRRCQTGTNAVSRWHRQSARLAISGGWLGHGTVGAVLATTVSAGADRIDFDRAYPFLGGAQSALGSLGEVKLDRLVQRAEDGSPTDHQKVREVFFGHYAEWKFVVARA